MCALRYCNCVIYFRFSSNYLLEYLNTFDKYNSSCLPMYSFKLHVFWISIPRYILYFVILLSSTLCTATCTACYTKKKKKEYKKLTFHCWIHVNREEGEKRRRDYARTLQVSNLNRKSAVRNINLLNCYRALISKRAVTFYYIFALTHLLL